MLVCQADEASASDVPLTPSVFPLQRIGVKLGIAIANQTECPSRRSKELVNHSPVTFFPITCRERGDA